MLRHQDAVAPKRMAMTSGQWIYRMGTLALLLVVVSSGIFGLVHQHAEHEPADEHRCAVCHVQQMTAEPDVLAFQILPAAFRGRAHVSETEPIDGLADRHAQPLRGPPAG